MAVTVIERREPGDKPRRIVCGGCDSTLEFRPSHVRFEPDVRDGNAYVVTCPVCANENWVAAGSSEG